jgi:O-antigen ligase
MGFVLSILYFATYYLTPPLLFGPLATYHIELILAALLSLISIPKLVRSFTIRTPQALALTGLAVAVLMSVMVGAGWVGGGVQAFMGFIPNPFGYFLVALHCDSKKKLRALVVMLLFVCLFVISQGALALRSADVVLANGGMSDDGYLFAMRSDAGQWFYRLRGLGTINDPNDFGQVIICVIPLLFILWRKNKGLANSACVLLPLGGLLIGVFLTHSRGALVALIALAVVSTRKRIGTIPALMLAAVMFALSMALQFTGGRDISASSGEDRTALWGESLQLFKSHPLFGVGFGNLPDYLGHTAHNSVAVCAGELGFFGLFFWSLFLFPTLRDALVLASPEKVSEGKPVVGETELFPRETRTIEHIDKDEVNHLGCLLLLSISGFLLTGWFLSRAFVMTLFLLGGMVEVVYEMALDRGMVAPRLRLARVVPYSGVLAISLLVVMYIMLRTVNLMH